MRPLALTKPSFNKLIKEAKMLMDLLAGDGKEATGPMYLQEMIRAVQATMALTLYFIKSLVMYIQFGFKI